MIIPVIILTIIIVHFVNVNYEKKKAQREWEEKLQAYEMSRPAARNIPLQYMYTIDEWYRLRCEFDKRIAPDWERYRVNEMTSMAYREACLKAVREIIPSSHYHKYPTLLRYGCYCAAMKVYDLGYAPGCLEKNPITKGEMKAQQWKPDVYIIPAILNRTAWMACAPADYRFLDLYPHGQVMDYMGCGRMRSTGWVPEYREDANCKWYYSGSYKYEPADRWKAIHTLQARGFDGHKYTNEPERHYNGLSENEIKRKYEFILQKPDMMREDIPVQCELWINYDHYETNMSGYDGKGRQPKYKTID